MKRYLFLILALLFAFSLFGQKSGKNDISFGVLTQGEFYLFSGTKQYYVFGEYRRSYKNLFARFRVSYFNKSYGGTMSYMLGTDTTVSTFLWLEADHEANFQFKDQIPLRPKTGLKSFGTQVINSTLIDFDMWLGYYFKLGKRKRFQIEPSVGLTAYYFRDDGIWLQFPLQFGDSVNNPNLADKQVGIFATTRGIVWGPELDISFRYYLKKRYSFGLNLIGGSNKYFYTFYMGAFIGFNF